MKLLWNAEGRVCCEGCAPARGTTSFVVERWAVMSVADRAAYAMELGDAVRCHSCMASEMAKRAVTP